MKKMLFILLSASCMLTSLYAQSYQRKALSKVLNCDLNAGNYSFEIWARNDSAGTTLFVGNSQFFLLFNFAALTNPTLTNINPKYTGITGSGNYDPMTVQIVGGDRLSVTIRYTGNAGGSSQLATASPDTNGERICTVNLQVTNGNSTAMLNWDSTNSAVLTTGTFSVFNRFVGLDNRPTPVQLSRFIATVVNQSRVRLDWTTISEVNNYGFFVERKRNSESAFTEIPNSFIPGHGTTNELHNYTFTDQSPSAPTLQYRLRQVDLDGTVHHTEPIHVGGITSVEGREIAPLEFALKQNYPNPFNPSTEIKFSVEKTDRATLELYNITGQKVATLFDDVAEAGQYYRVRVDGTNLASGVYFSRLMGNGKSQQKKLMLLK